jgi:GMP synthase-like glutamine amidotransferase
MQRDKIAPVRPLPGGFMTLHVVQHFPFEGPGRISAWARERCVAVNVIPVHAGALLPVPGPEDGVVVLGGPMSVHDAAAHPWIEDELAWLKRLARQDVPVLGICLGAQLMARALDAPVTRCASREIGWFPVTPDATTGDAPAWLDPAVPVFHWHGEQFDLPRGARPIGSTAACPVQGFRRGRLTGLQFHLETTPQIAADLVEACGDELDGGPWIQDMASILGTSALFSGIHRQLDELLDETFRAAP